MENHESGEYEIFTLYKLSKSQNVARAYSVESSGRHLPASSVKAHLQVVQVSDLGQCIC